jgi:hypothetical protein
MNDEDIIYECWKLREMSDETGVACLKLFYEMEKSE